MQQYDVCVSHKELLDFLIISSRTLPSAIARAFLLTAHELIEGKQEIHEKYIVRLTVEDDDHVK